MKIEDLMLNEYILPSQFKFGFELEAIGNQLQSLPEFKRFALNFLDGEFGTDPTISTDKRTDESFEYKSGVLDFTPANLQKFIFFLNKLPEYHVRTNASCSLHIHFSYPDMRPQDAFWFIINLALNEEKQKEFLSLGKYKFFSEKYASTEIFDKIKYFAEEDGGEKVLGVFYSNDKYNLFRIHPIGTIEWRGPRDFLNDRNKENIMVFVKKMYSLVKYMGYTTAQKSITYKGKTISRDLVFNTIKDKKVYFDNKKGTKLDRILKDGRFSHSQNMTILPEIRKKFPWFFKGKFKFATVRIDGESLVFQEGIWEDGVFGKGGVFESGFWKGGTFKGRWISGKIKVNGEWKTSTNAPREVDENLGKTYV